MAESHPDAINICDARSRIFGVLGVSAGTATRSAGAGATQEDSMTSKLLLALPAVALAGLAVFLPSSAPAGGVTPVTGYKVLEPIRQGNLTVFPVVAAQSHDTQDFLTLDEGLRSGEVMVTESGSVQPLMRRRRTPVQPGGAQVNQLVLVNNSKRPLILLAGEIVIGGKQDRVIGK